MCMRTTLLLRLIPFRWNMKGCGDWQLLTWSRMALLPDCRNCLTALKPVLRDDFSLWRDRGLRWQCTDIFHGVKTYVQWRAFDSDSEDVMTEKGALTRVHWYFKIFYTVVRGKPFSFVHICMCMRNASLSQVRKFCSNEMFCGDDYHIPQERHGAHLRLQCISEPHALSPTTKDMSRMIEQAFHTLSASRIRVGNWPLSWTTPCTRRCQECRKKWCIACCKGLWTTMNSVILFPTLCNAFCLCDPWTKQLNLGFVGRVISSVDYHVTDENESAEGSMCEWYVHCVVSLSFDLYAEHQSKNFGYLRDVFWRPCFLDEGSLRFWHIP